MDADHLLEGNSIKASDFFFFKLVNESSGSVVFPVVISELWL